MIAVGLLLYKGLQCDTKTGSVWTWKYKWENSRGWGAEQWAGVRLGQAITSLLCVVLYRHTPSDDTER